MSKRIFLIISLLLLFVLLLAACGDQAEPTTFSVSSSKTDVDVRSLMSDEGSLISGKGNAITFLVYSPSGIDDATITLTGGKMPDDVHVRLFLKGLEHLELAYNDVTVTASVPSSGGPIQESVKEGDIESDIDDSYPYWIDIQSLPEKPGGLFIGEPIEGPSFLITLPEDFHKQDATEFTLKWVDFYR